MDERVTKPTIETVLERMNEMEQRLGERIEASVSASEHRMTERIEASVAASEQRTAARINKLEDELGTRLDRLESLTYSTRADFLDLRLKLREHLPALH